MVGPVLNAIPRMAVTALPIPQPLREGYRSKICVDKLRGDEMKAGHSLEEESKGTVRRGAGLSEN